MPFPSRHPIDSVLEATIIAIEHDALFSATVDEVADADIGQSWVCFDANGVAHRYVKPYINAKGEICTHA